jgi:two-component sensor histidine kinase
VRGEAAHRIANGPGSVVALLVQRRLVGSGADQSGCDIIAQVASATLELLARPGQMRLELEVDPRCAAPVKALLPLSLIVGELVTNSVKYAHPSGVPGVVRVICRQEEGGSLEIAVTDDGVGLPEAFDPDTADGLGLRLVRALAAQIGASLAFDTTNLGLAVQLRLPRERSRCPGTTNGVV